jgi:hypothetical protein
MIEPELRKLQKTVKIEKKSSKIHVFLQFFESSSLSPLRRSRVGMKLYFLVHTLENVNIWKFIT